MTICRWLAVRTHPRRERTACHHIERQGATPYCPIIFSRGKPEVLFPSYLFVHSCEISLRWLCSTVAVVAPVKVGDELAIVSDDLIEALRQREIDGVVRLDEERFTLGQTVKVTSGPFLDLRGLYDGMQPGERVCVLLNLMGRETRVICGEDMIEAA